MRMLSRKTLFAKIWHLTFLFFQSLIEHVHPQTFANAFQISHVISNLFDRIDLLLQIMSFQEIAQIHVHVP